MQNPMRNARAAFLSFCLLAQPLWAAPPITWIPEIRVAIVNMDRAGAEEKNMVEQMRAMGPMLDLPDGYFILLAPAGEATLNSEGEIRRTSFYLGDKKTDDAADLIGPLTAAGVPLASMKGMVLGTCYGGRPLPDGSPSIAKRIAQTFSFPVLATTGSITQTMALELDTETRTVRPTRMAFSQFALGGPTRISPWIIETPAVVSQEQIEGLRSAQKQLDQMQEGAASVGLIYGDLRSEQTNALNFPDVAGIVGTKQIEAQVRTEWRRFGLNLDRRNILALVINPLLPEIQLAQLEAGLAQIAGATASGNGYVVPILSRWWFLRELSIPQYLANKTHQIVFHPTVPSNAMGLSDSDFQIAIDYKHWVVVRPQLTRLPYFDDEVERLKAELEKTLGASKARPFSHINWAATCQYKLSNARQSWWRKLLTWPFSKSKS